MKLWAHRIELFVDLMIPYLLFILIGLLTMDYFVKDAHDSFRWGIESFDMAVMIFLITDLGFKYHRAKGAGDFLKRNWLEIIAAIPFALIIRMVERLVIVANVERDIQALSGKNKMEVYFLRLVKILGRESLILRANRLLAFLPKDAKLRNAIQFFEKPTGKHYHHEKTKN